MSTFSRPSPPSGFTPLPLLSPLMSPRSNTMPLPMTRTPSLLSRGNSYTSADLVCSTQTTPSPELPASERMGRTLSPADVSDAEGSEQSSSEVDMDEIETEADSSPERVEGLARSMGLRIDMADDSEEDGDGGIPALSFESSAKKTRPSLLLSIGRKASDHAQAAARDMKTPTNPQFPLSFVGINVHHPGIDSPLHPPFTSSSDRDDLDTPPVHSGSYKTPSNPYFPTIFHGIDLQHEGMNSPPPTLSAKASKRRTRSGDGADGLREVQARLEKVAVGQAKNKDGRRRVATGLPLRSPLDMSFTEAASALQLPAWSTDAPKTPVGTYKVELNGINASPYLAAGGTEPPSQQDTPLKRPGTPTHASEEATSDVTASPSSMLAALALSPPKKTRIRPAARTARTFPLTLPVPTVRSLSASMEGGLASPLPRIEISDAPLPSPTAFEVAQNIQKATAALANRHSALVSAVTSPTSAFPPSYSMATAADAAMRNGPEPLDRSQPVSVFRKRQRRSVDGNMDIALRPPIDAEGRRRPNLGGGLKLDLAGMGMPSLKGGVRVPASVPEAEGSLEMSDSEVQDAEHLAPSPLWTARADPASVGLGINMMGLGSPCHILTPSLSTGGPMRGSAEVVSPLALSALSPLSTEEGEGKPW